MAIGYRTVWKSARQKAIELRYAGMRRVYLARAERGVWTVWSAVSDAVRGMEISIPSAENAYRPYRITVHAIS